MDYTEKAFEQLYKERYRLMYRLAYFMLEDDEEARDVVVRHLQTYGRTNHKLRMEL